ncbi:MAG TPA: hypothetical protein VGA61_02410 [Anaerolineae bacterium]
MERTKPMLTPDFTLLDTEGRRVQLAGYRGKSDVVLVFLRGFA